MNFDLYDFRLLLNIAETKSLTKAAEKSFLSTPAASNRIKNLEEQLDLKLLIRLPHGVELTEVGEICLKYAKSIFHQLDCLRGELSKHNKLIQGTLSIVANTTAITEYIPKTLAKYLSAEPNVAVSLKELTSEEVVNAVVDKRADIGIIFGTVDTKNLQILPLISSRLVLITPKSHPILEKDDISLTEIMKYSLVSLQEGSAIHTFLQKLSYKIDKRFTVRVQVSSYDAICQMVAVGTGISIIPLVAFERLKHIHPNIEFRDINEEWALRNFQICAIDFDDLSKFSKDFVDCLQSHIN